MSTDSSKENRLRDRLRDASTDRLLQSSLEIPQDRIVEKKADPGARVAGGATIESGKPTGKRGLGRGEYLAIKGRLHRQLLDELEDVELLLGEEAEMLDRINEFVEDVLASEDLPISETERKSLPTDLLEETLGVGPLAPLLIDPAVTDILVNRHDEIFVERRGRLEESDIRFRDNDHLMRIIQRIAARVGRHVDDASPMLDARLPDGSRVNATIPPITIDGATMSIRRFGRRRMKRYELLERLMFSPDMDTFMNIAVKHRGKALRGWPHFNELIAVLIAACVHIGLLGERKHRVFHRRPVALESRIEHIADEKVWLMPQGQKRTSFFRHFTHRFVRHFTHLKLASVIVGCLTPIMPISSSLYPPSKRLQA